MHCHHKVLVHFDSHLSLRRYTWFFVYIRGNTKFKTKKEILLVMRGERPHNSSSGSIVLLLLMIRVDEGGDESDNVKITFNIFFLFRFEQRNTNKTAKKMKDGKKIKQTKEGKIYLFCEWSYGISIAFSFILVVQFLICIKIPIESIKTL